MNMNEKIAKASLRAKRFSRRVRGLSKYDKTLVSKDYDVNVNFSPKADRENPFCSMHLKGTFEMTLFKAMLILLSIFAFFTTLKLISSVKRLFR